MEQTSTNHSVASEGIRVMVFTDYLAEIERRFNQEKDIKNAAFFFLISKGLYNEFHDYMRNPPQDEGEESE